MKLYKIPTKSDKGTYVFVDLEQVEMVSCQLDYPVPDIGDVIAGVSRPQTPIAMIQLGTVGGRNFEFSLDSVELAEQWLQTHFSLTYEFNPK